MITVYVKKSNKYEKYYKYSMRCNVSNDPNIFLYILSFIILLFNLYITIRW